MTGDQSQSSLRMLRYGDEAPLPERRTLRAGPLTAVLENGDLRYLRVGDIEIVRRLYMAIRNRNWDTIPGRFTRFEVEDRGDSFAVRFSCEHVQGDVDFVWDGEIAGTADGAIRYTMDGQPRRAFLRNRIGFCVLHPMDLAGVAASVETPDGTIDGAFPNLISPHQPFVDMRSISHAAGASARVTIRFAGDLFEMEDQRNWTDASYKTYCTPLRIPYPVEVTPADRIEQTVAIFLTGAAASDEASGDDADVVVSATPAARLPRIGFVASKVRRTLSEDQTRLLRRLAPSHLWIDLDLGADDWEARFDGAARQAASLGASLELSVVADRGLRGLSSLAARIASSGGVSRVYVFPSVAANVTFPRHDLETSDAVIDAARAAFDAAGVNVPIGGGARAYFTELNRADALPVAKLDALTYTINPQVHAFDNLSLIETLAAQAATVESARAIAGDRPLAIGPISFLPQFNPNATGPAPVTPPDALPPSVDPRQLSLFGAGWTVGSLHRLAETGVDALTYYETIGWRGLIEAETGLTRRDRFPSTAGQLFPLYHVFAALAPFAAGETLPVALRDPLATEALAVRMADRLLILVANLADEPRELRLRVPPLARSSVRVLDETTAARAMSDPEFFAADDGDELGSVGDERSLHLKPFAVARIAATLATA